MTVRPLLQKLFWAVLAAGCIYFALHKPAQLPAPGAQRQPAGLDELYPWPATWDC